MMIIMPSFDFPMYQISAPRLIIGLSIFAAIAVVAWLYSKPDDK